MCQPAAPDVVHEAEDRLFTSALLSLDRWVTHPHTLVLRLSDAPTGYERSSTVPTSSRLGRYHRVARPLSGAAWQRLTERMAKPAERCLDLRGLAGTERTLEQIQLACTVAAPP